MSELYIGLAFAAFWVALCVGCACWLSNSKNDRIINRKTWKGIRDEYQ